MLLFWQLPSVINSHFSQSYPLQKFYFVNLSNCIATKHYIPTWIFVSCCQTMIVCNRANHAGMESSSIYDITV